MKILQNAFTISDTEIKIGYIEEGKIEYIKTEKNSLNTLTDFVTYCNAESNLILDSFICQFTEQQTLSKEFSERVWVKQGDESFDLRNLSITSAYINFKNELENIINQ
jgi:hypothetical protein